MGFSLEHSFVVKAPADRVWAFLTDPTRVASALPGAAITEKVGDDKYNGTITVKVGPVSARYRGSVRFEALDAGARTAKIVGSGQDTSGRGGADLRMSSRLLERSPQETEVSLTSEVNVTGILAQFGRGMIQDVSNQMVSRFTEAMRAQLETAPEAAAPAAGNGGGDGALADPPDLGEVGDPPPSTGTAAPQSPPIEVLSFGGGIAGRAALRALRRPLFWLILLALVILIWLLTRKVTTMIPPAFDYHAPATLPEALALLGRFGDEAKILSGGQSLLPCSSSGWRSRPTWSTSAASPTSTTSRRRAASSASARSSREAALEASPLVARRYPILLDTAARDRRPARAQPGHRRAATWPTATRPTITPRPCWPSAPRWWPPDPRARAPSRWQSSSRACSPPSSTPPRS